jgi:hypothetical protein
VMTDPRLARLRGRHAWLETTIAQELSRPLPDFARIRDLKRRKLILKEAIVRRADGLLSA